MRGLSRILGVPVRSERFASGMVQAACFAAAPAILVLALNALARLSSRPVEILIGVLAASGVALSLVRMGLVIGQIGQRSSP